jgi:hypothetical protein
MPNLLKNCKEKKETERKKGRKRREKNPKKNPNMAIKRNNECG